MQGSQKPVCGHCTHWTLKEPGAQRSLFYKQRALCRASLIGKYFYKASRECDVQILCLPPLRYKTKPLEEEPKDSFSSGILFYEILNLRLEVRL